MSITVPIPFDERRRRTVVGTVAADPVLALILARQHRTLTVGDFYLQGAGRVSSRRHSPRRWREPRPAQK